MAGCKARVCGNVHYLRCFGFVPGYLDHEGRGRGTCWVGPLVRFEHHERSGKILLSHGFWF
jgi:hypothetical protein